MPIEAEGMKFRFFFFASWEYYEFMKQPFKLAHPQVYEIIDHLYDVIWQHVMIRLTLLMDWAGMV